MIRETEEVEMQPGAYKQRYDESLLLSSPQHRWRLVLRLLLLQPCSASEKVKSPLTRHTAGEGPSERPCSLAHISHTQCMLINAPTYTQGAGGGGGFFARPVCQCASSVLQHFTSHCLCWLAPCELSGSSGPQCPAHAAPSSVLPLYRKTYLAKRSNTCCHTGKRS